jgi:signal peptidase I
MTSRLRRLLKEYFIALFWIIPLAFLIRSVGYGLYRTESGSMEPLLLVGDRVFADKLTIHVNPPSRGDVITFSDPQFNYSNSSWIAKIQQLVWGPCNVTKRVIAVPGDHIKGLVEDGKPVVYLNGKKLEESYVNTYPLLPVDAWRGIWKTYVPDKPYHEQPYYTFNENEVMAAQKWLERRGRSTIRQPFVPLSQGGSDQFDIVLAENQYWVMGDNRQASIDSRHWGPLNGSLVHGKIRYRLWSIDSDSHWFVTDLLFHPIDFWKKLRWSRSFQKVV